MTIAPAATPTGFINITDRERGVGFYLQPKRPD